MPLRPLVLKVHFYAQGGGAIGHLEYMGNPSKEELVRAGERGDPRDDAAVHAAYMAGRPGSTGYIGPDPGRLPDPTAIAAELRGHQGPVWRAFVSVTEDDARAMGGALLDRPAWEDAARVNLPMMAQKLGIPQDRLRWVAAMHRKEGHPHIHLLMWEHPPQRQRVKWSQTEIRDIKRMWVSSLYRPERERLAREKSAARDVLVRNGRGDVAAGVRVARGRGLDGIPPRLSTGQAAALGRNLDDLRALLPGDGRVALKFMPPEVKDQARRIADWLTNRVPEYRAPVDRYAAIAAEMAGHYSDDPAAHQKAADNAKADLRDRLSQSVLQGAVRLDRAGCRDEVVEVALAAIRGQGDGKVSDDLAGRIHQEVRRIAGMKGEARKEAAGVLARELLADPQLRPDVDRFLAAHPAKVRDIEEQRLVATVSKSIEHAADYVSFRESTSAQQAAVAMFMGLFKTVREEELKAERLAAEEEIARVKRRQMEHGMDR